MKLCQIEGCNNMATQLAHRIPQTKHNIHVYGELVIHHPLNLVPVCSLECNSKVSISNHPLAEKRLLSKIYEQISEKLYEEYCYQDPGEHPATPPSYSGPPKLASKSP